MKKFWILSVIIIILATSIICLEKLPSRQIPSIIQPIQQFVQRCDESWSCTSWSKCVSSQQTRICTDRNNCGTVLNKPAEVQSCSCIEDWSCTSWSDCVDNQQNRVCTDANKCGTTKDKPTETKSCKTEEEEQFEKELSEASKADVIIITAGSNLTKTLEYYDTINRYKKIIQAEELSSVYIDLDSPVAEKIFDKTDTNDWQSVKQTLNKIVQKLSPKYILILGGVSIIPQPPAYLLPDIISEYVPSDDRYSDLDDNRVLDVAVARIPTPSDTKSADIIITALKSAIKMHEKQESLSKLLIVGKCDFPQILCVEFDAYLASINMFGVACSNAEACITAPPYCAGSNCAKGQEFYDKLLNSDFIYLSSHGYPYGFSSYDKEGTDYEILSSKDLYKRKFQSNPIFITNACYSSTIDCKTDFGCISKDGNVYSFFANGGSVFVGDTRSGIARTPNLFALLGDSTSGTLNDFYRGLKSGKRVGDAWLEAKNWGINEVRYLVGSGELQMREYHNAIKFELQLYGDPTLRVKFQP